MIKFANKKRKGVKSEKIKIFPLVCSKYLSSWTGPDLTKSRLLVQFCTLDNGRLSSSRNVGRCFSRFRFSVFRADESNWKCISLKFAVGGREGFHSIGSRSLMQVSQQRCRDLFKASFDKRKWTTSQSNLTC